ncbi:hypothetical protein LTR86_009961 [Recurvomyces mirabilis]|nr:hypothetical protein LTR86_009961 [Recurvomyces mirabilis]
MVSSSFATATYSTAGPAATGAMSFTGDAFQAAVLNSTNYYRAQHQAGALSWNDTLAKFAQDTASKCIWQHSGGPYGENLAEGYDSPVPAIDAWAGEENRYNYAKPKFHESTGHYTQLVWQNTTSVGCGAVQCNSDSSDGVKGWMMVCEYFPPGNVGGQYRQQVLKPGENAKDQLGFGAAPKIGAGRRFISALVLSYVLMAVLS